MRYPQVHALYSDVATRSFEACSVAIRGNPTTDSVGPVGLDKNIVDAAPTSPVAQHIAPIINNRLVPFIALPLNFK